MMNRKNFLDGYMFKYAEQPVLSPGVQKLYGGDVIPKALNAAGVQTPEGGFNPEYTNFYMNELGSKGIVPSLINPDNRYAVPGAGGVAGAALGGLLGGAEGAMIGGALGAIAGWIAEHFFPGQINALPAHPRKCGSTQRDSSRAADAG